MRLRLIAPSLGACALAVALTIGCSSFNAGNGSGGNSSGSNGSGSAADGGGEGSAGPTGQVTFQWAFLSADVACGQVNVDQIKIAVGGSAWTVPCFDVANKLQGATLNLPIGAQAFTLTAYGAKTDAQGNVVAQSQLYSYSDSVTVTEGDSHDTGVLVLTSAAIGTAPGSRVGFHWNFGSNECAAAGVANVHVQITDFSTNATVDQVAPCTAGGFQGASFGPFISSGVVVGVGFKLTAMSAANTALYETAATYLPDNYDDAVILVDLEDPASNALAQGSGGGLALQFDFGSGKTCADVGLDKINAAVRSTTGLIYSASASCAPVSGQTTSQFQLGNFNGCTDVGDLDIQQHDIAYVDVEGLDSSGNMTYFLSQQPIASNSCETPATIHVTVPKAP